MQLKTWNHASADKILRIMGQIRFQRFMLLRLEKDSYFCLTFSVVIFSTLISALSAHASQSNSRTIKLDGTIKGSKSTRSGHIEIKTSKNPTETSSKGRNAAVNITLNLNKRPGFKGRSLSQNTAAASAKIQQLRKSVANVSRNFVKRVGWSIRRLRFQLPTFSDESHNDVQSASTVHEVSENLEYDSKSAIFSGRTLFGKLLRKKARLIVRRNRVIRKGLTSLSKPLRRNINKQGSKLALKILLGSKEHKESCTLCRILNGVRQMTNISKSGSDSPESKGSAFRGRSLNLEQSNMNHSDSSVINKILKTLNESTSSESSASHGASERPEYNTIAQNEKFTHRPDTGQNIQGRAISDISSNSSPSPASSTLSSMATESQTHPASSEPSSESTPISSPMSSSSEDGIQGRSLGLSPAQQEVTTAAASPSDNNNAVSTQKSAVSGVVSGDGSGTLPEKEATNSSNLSLGSSAEGRSLKLSQSTVQPEEIKASEQSTALVTEASKTEAASDSTTYADSTVSSQPMTETVSSATSQSESSPSSESLTSIQGKSLDLSSTTVQLEHTITESLSQASSAETLAVSEQTSLATTQKSEENSPSGVVAGESSGQIEGKDNSDASSSNPVSETATSPAPTLVPQGRSGSSESSSEGSTIINDSVETVTAVQGSVTAESKPKETMLSEPSSENVTASTSPSSSESSSEPTSVTSSESNSVTSTLSSNSDSSPTLTNSGIESVSSDIAGRSAQALTSTEPSSQSSSTSLVSVSESSVQESTQTSSVPASEDSKTSNTTETTLASLPVVSDSSVAATVSTAVSVSEDSTITTTQEALKTIEGRNSVSNLSTLQELSSTEPTSVGTAAMSEESSSFKTAAESALPKDGGVVRSDGQASLGLESSTVESTTKAPERTPSSSSRASKVESTTSLNVPTAKASSKGDESQDMQIFLDDSSLSKKLRNSLESAARRFLNRTGRNGASSKIFGESGSPIRESSESEGDQDIIEVINISEDKPEDVVRGRTLNREEGVLGDNKKVVKLNVTGIIRHHLKNTTSKIFATIRKVVSDIKKITKSTAATARSRGTSGRSLFAGLPSAKTEMPADKRGKLSGIVRNTAASGSSFESSSGVQQNFDVAPEDSSSNTIIKGRRLRGRSKLAKKVREFVANRREARGRSLSSDYDSNLSENSQDSSAKSSDRKLSLSITLNRNKRRRSKEPPITVEKTDSGSVRSFKGRHSVATIKRDRLGRSFSFQASSHRRSPTSKRPPRLNIALESNSKRWGNKEWMARTGPVQLSLKG